MATWNSRGLRGSTLEDLINRTNEKYLENGLALIQKIPTPITPIKIDSYLFWCQRMCHWHVFFTEYPWTSGCFYGKFWKAGWYSFFSDLLYGKEYFLLSAVWNAKIFLGQGKKWRKKKFSLWRTESGLYFAAKKRYFSAVSGCFKKRFGR